ncbi:MULTISPECIES: LacI family DNA-binding transcriptional regulator [Streptomyces]|uniref:LacI family transcriptional regulator n=1 Tax=Streptomyces viridochromogenes TaxID=1938 RepID=A0A0L8L8N7_STRVR|nr:MULTISPECIES: LacI family DNA-binding transcriptional regulator [Streptomyces]KOG34436.1 LacI family transcriptional regulator [Streptomyces viridochromogenes]
MADVAQLAGVSSQTVSRVSNGDAAVVESTRLKVLEAMNQLGYRPNSAARALKRGDFRAIGVITMGLTSTGNVRTLDAIAGSASREGYAVTLIPLDAPTQENVKGAFTRLDELAVDAVVLIMEVHLLDTAALTLPPHVKVVVVDSDATGRFPVVDTDQRQGARQAVQHLLDLGHETVWHLAGPEESFAADRRSDAWEAALREEGRAVPPALRGDWTPESGYEAGLRLADEAGCTAVFVANDQMALGVLRAFHERGRRVPEDVSVVGFDDITDAASYIPPLTTVRQDFAQVGALCVDAALRELRGETVTGVRLVPTALVERSSTAHPRPAGSV